MTLTKIKEIFSVKSKKSDISVGGWVRAFRGNRFIELNDGSSQKNIQCVINPETTDSETMKNINVGSSIIITGKRGMNWSRIVKPVIRFSLRKFFYKRLKEFDGPSSNILSLTECYNLAKIHNLELNEIDNTSIVTFTKF